MAESRLKEYIDINPTVKLQRGELYSSVEMEKITVGKKIVDASSKAEYTGKSCSKFLPNDTLMARITPCLENGKIAKYESGTAGFGSTEFFVLRAKKKKTTADYVYYLSQTDYVRQLAINSMTGASGRQRADAKFIGNIKWDFPEIGIQSKVADILSTYDNLIENNNKRIKLLEQMTESLYKEWFVRFRFSRYEDVEFIDGFPKDWEKVKLDDVLNKIATGLNPRKNFVLGEGENFYVTIKNMADNTVYLDDKCDKVNDDAIIKINKRSDLKIGDLLFSGIGTIGRVCLIDIPTNNWNISESVFTMRANKKISSEFLYMLLLSQDVQNYCQSKANGSAQKGIRMGDLRKYTFLLPTKNVINDFTNQISPILRNVSLLRKENKNLIQQRDMLLPRLMSGKLEV